MSEVKDFSAFRYAFKCAHCGEEFDANRLRELVREES